MFKKKIWDFLFNGKKGRKPQRTNLKNQILKKRKKELVCWVGGENSTKSSKKELFLKKLGKLNLEKRKKNLEI